MPAPFPPVPPDLPTRILTVLRARPSPPGVPLHDLARMVREGWRLPATLRDLEHAGLVQSWLVEEVVGRAVIQRRYYAAEA